MTAQISADSLHRLIKHAIDSGAAASVAEAEALFQGYRLQVEIDPAVICDPVQQAAALTTVALGRRVFLGGVTVTGPLDAPLMRSGGLAGWHLASPFRAAAGLWGRDAVERDACGRISCQRGVPICERRGARSWTTGVGAFVVAP